MPTVDLRCGDCLSLFNTLEPQSVDAVIADIPYGTTQCPWDSVIPFEPMWAGIKHAIKPNGAIVLFGSQPFTSALVMSNPQMFRYSWVWDKVMVSNFLNAKREPLVDHEDIVVFSAEINTYNPQFGQASKPFSASNVTSETPCYGKGIGNIKQSGVGYPKTILRFPRPNNLTDGGFHPTQKPVALMEYLVRTYANDGETVLDFTMGSGSTMVACVNTNRNGIGWEIREDYFKTAQERVKDAEREIASMIPMLRDLPRESAKPKQATLFG